MQAESFTALQSYVSQLKNLPGVGRMAVIADPAVLIAHPTDDPLLEDGDNLYIPPRPFTVSVLGEVLQPNNVPYKADFSSQDYVNQAGGFSQLADSNEVYVVLPNGAAFRNEDTWFGFGKREIPPGSTVFVGRDISGYDIRQGVLDVTGIFSSLATSMAAIAVMSKQ